MNDSTNIETAKTRPGGITVLAIILAWLGLVGLSNAWFVFAGEYPDMGPLVGVAALIYAVSALGACVGLWRMAPWALKALHTWMLVCVAIFLGFALGFDDFIRGSIPGMIGFAIFIGLLFLGIHRFVTIKFDR